MSHIVRMPKEDRVSLQTLNARPNQPITLGIALFVPGLKLVALAEDGSVCGSCTITEVKTTKPNFAVNTLSFKGVGTFRVELRMGDAMWDWLRVDTKTAGKDASTYAATGTGKVKVEVLWTKEPGRNPMTHYKTVAEMML